MLTSLCPGSAKKVSAAPRAPIEAHAHWSQICQRVVQTASQCLDATGVPQVASALTTGKRSYSFSKHFYIGRLPL